MMIQGHYLIRVMKRGMRNGNFVLVMTCVMWLNRNYFEEVRTEYERVPGL